MEIMVDGAGGKDQTVFSVVSVGNAGEIKLAMWDETLENLLLRLSLQSTERQKSG